MKKLTLDPESLRVDTFAPAEARLPGGTVRGHDDSVNVCDPQEPQSIAVCATDPSICGTGTTPPGTATCPGGTGGTVTLFTPSGMNTCAGFSTCDGFTCEERYGAGCAGPQLPGC